MASNLFESMQQQLTPDMIQHVSASLGETPAHAQAAVDQSIAITLVGLMHLSSLNAGPIQLLNVINQANYGSLLNNLSGLREGGNTAQNLMTAGQNILNTLFPDKLHSVSELIATTSGVSTASASSLLSLAAPVVIGVLGRVRSMQGLNAVRLAALLMSQKEGILKLVPEGLAGVFGLPSLAALEAGRTGAAPESSQPDTVSRVATALQHGTNKLKNWRWPVLAVVALGFLYFLMGRSSEVAQTGTVAAASSSTPGTVSVPLPNGTALALKEGSFNYNVAAFLTNPAVGVTPKTFVFDHLTFDAGTTKLTVGSEQTVNDLNTILKAFPAVDVRLEGYTDNVGDPAANQTLSLDRAAAVRAALINGGLGVTRVTTAGYGQEKPLTSNETEEGRANNQRLELVVVRK